MAPQLRKVNTSVLIAGVEFPVLKWSCTLASQGNMGTASAEGSLGDLVSSGLDIIAASQAVNGAELDIYVGYQGDSQLIFSGVVDTCDLDFDEDKFEIKGRDFAAVLADGKQTVAGLNYRGQTIGQIVQQIANKFGFTANVTDSGVLAGPTLNGDNSFNPHPQSYWHLLQSLADQVGYECYLLPGQVLFFGPERPQSSINVNYGAPPNSGAENPGWGLRIVYNPRNNSNVVVKALSYNPQSTQSVVASASAQPVVVGKGRKTASSLAGGKPRYPTAGSSGNKSPAKSIYYLRCPGLSPEQAQARCQSVANDLAKHQIIAEMTIEGLPGLVLHSQVTIVESTIDLYGFAGVPLNVSEVTHSFSTPSDGDSSGGFDTSFRAIALLENA